MRRTGNGDARKTSHRASASASPAGSSGGSPLLREAGKAPRSGGWGAESRYGSMQVCGDGRAIRPGPKQRTTPHPAPWPVERRASRRPMATTFPSKLGKGSARGSKNIFSARLPRLMSRDEAARARRCGLFPLSQRKAKRGCAPSAIREIARLRRVYGRGRWRKRKRTARVRLPDGSVHLAEVHWYEASGIGRKEFKIKHLI